MSVPAPRAMIEHKRWLAEQPDRNPVKRPRDKAQADALAWLCDTYQIDRQPR